MHWAIVYYSRVKGDGDPPTQEMAGNLQ